MMKKPYKNLDLETASSFGEKKAQEQKIEDKVPQNWRWFSVLIFLEITVTLCVTISVISCLIKERYVNEIGVPNSILLAVFLILLWLEIRYKTQITLASFLFVSFGWCISIIVVAALVLRPENKLQIICAAINVAAQILLFYFVLLYRSYKQSLFVSNY